MSQKSPLPAPSVQLQARPFAAVGAWADPMALPRPPPVTVTGPLTPWTVDALVAHATLETVPRALSPPAATATLHRRRPVMPAGPMIVWAAVTHWATLTERDTVVVAVTLVASLAVCGPRYCRVR